ncbi:REP-associated tyrosine transposase [Thermoflexales bacterium]|nr:REP-associated tyrosine transposase [Thermoflexales bacterium]
MPAYHPPHIYLDDTWYFVTASIHHRHRLLQPSGHKDLVRDQLKAMTAEFHIQLAAWVILDNHYHILVRSHVGQDLSRMFGRWHGRTAFEINGRDDERGRQVWHNYWDTCIRTEADYWTRFNYIHHNPVKHGYVGRMEDWPFSSYCYYRDHEGNAWLSDAFERFPIVDFTDPDDDF